MNSVVMIAYHFPPEGNAGAYRPLRFVRHLRNMGWLPTVISAIPSQYERYDSTLMTMVPDEVCVVRVKASDQWLSFQARRSRKLQESSSTRNDLAESRNDGRHSSFRAWLREKVRCAEAWWYHPDMAAPWINPAVTVTTQVCVSKQSSVIWATAGPVSAFYAARLASRKTRVPYVLDFRDAWTIVHNEFESRRPFWAIKRDRRRMYRLLRDARAVVFRYHTEAECFWRAYHGALEPLRIHVIPNGYESPIAEEVVPTGDKCTILYAGTLSEYRYDTFLQAVRQLKNLEPVRVNQLRLRFIGEGTDALGKEAAVLGLRDVVETEGPKSFSQISVLQQRAHALLMLGRLPSMKGYELFAGAKLFGYLKAGRPIIGVLPEDETKKILQRVGASTIADVDSVSDIVRVLQLVLDKWSMGTLSSLIPDRKACEAYSSERQTASLVRALEGLPPEEPFVPGAQTVPPSLQEAIESKDWREVRDRH
jgi:hypothetical protein